MSPEQARGEKVDGRSDLFSLGCILYECLSGEKAFKGESITAILLKVLTEEPKPVDFAAIGLPSELSPVLRRATAKNASERFASGAELMEAVRELVAPGRPAATSTMGALPRAEPPPVPPTVRSAPVIEARASRSRVPWAVAIVLLTALAGLLWSRNSERSRSDPPGAKGELVVEEPPGFFRKLMGGEARLRITVPEKTTLALSLETALSSETAAAGDEFTATLSKAVAVEGFEALPAGSRIRGHVSHAEGAGKVSGRGSLALELDVLEIPDGDRVDIQAEPLAFDARSTKKKDAGVIGGLAGVGAVVGGIIGGKKGAVVGGAAGGGAGTGVVLSTRGEEVVLPQGAAFSARLSSPFTITRDKPSGESPKSK
jgi:hypothetical protein